MPSARYPEFNGTEPCRRDPNSWVPADEEGPSGQTAKMRCGGCHVKSECLAWGLSVDEVGIYGGMTTKERQQLTGRGPRTINGPLERGKVRQAQGMLADGYSVAETARTLGVHMTTITKYRSLGVEREERPPAPKKRATCVVCQRRRAEVATKDARLYQLAKKAVRFPTPENIAAVDQQKSDLARGKQILVEHEADCAVSAGMSGLEK